MVPFAAFETRVTLSLLPFIQSFIIVGVVRARRQAAALA
jgi:hypothetical protein